MEQLDNQSPVESFGEGLSPLELRAAQDATLAFLMAVKNYSLFPPDHASTINLLNTLCATIGGFLQKYGPLRLDIEKNLVRYEEEVVFEEANPDNNPAFIFYRDGILWLEFMPGLKPHEMLGFFRIVSRFRLTQEDPEGDLVTELWGSDFEHINYQATDNLWEAEPILEFSLLNPDAQSVLEYGVAAVAGFDLLKSVLGAFSAGAAGGEDGVGSGGAGGVGAAGPGLGPGDGAGLGPGLGSGDGSGAGGGLGAGDGSGVIGGIGGSKPLGKEADAAAAGQPGASAGSARPGGGGTGGSGGAESGKGAKPLPQEEPDGPDFWATLRRNTLAVQGLGAPGPAASGEVGQPEGHNRQGSSAGVSVYTATGHLPGAIGDNLTAAGPISGATGGGQPGEPGKSARVGGAVGAPGGCGGDASSSIAARKATAFSRPGRGGDWSEGDDKEESYISVNVASIEPGHSLWQFSSEEQLELARMVREHEDGDNNSDIVELLLILLVREEEPLIFAAILAFLKEEFRITLISRRFDIGHALLGKVYEIRRELAPEKEWAQPLLGRFFEDIVEPEILASLTTLWPELPVQKPEVLQEFSAILRLLPPAAGVALVPLLSKVEDGVGRRILLDMIGVFASRDLAIIDKMLDRPEEDLLLRLIQVLQRSPQQRQTEELLIKALKHPKESVRLNACGVLMDLDTEHYERIFQLIYDSSPAIRESAFRYLGRERNREVEKLLLAHLASDRFLGENPEHIGKCYLALGFSGSDDSLPHLQRVLFGQPWNFLMGIGAGVHRQGAALAISKLRTRASIKLIGEAESSSIPHIRKAWAKATGG